MFEPEQLIPQHMRHSYGLTRFSIQEVPSSLKHKSLKKGWLRKNNTNALRHNSLKHKSLKKGWLTKNNTNALRHNSLAQLSHAHQSRRYRWLNHVINCIETQTQMYHVQKILRPLSIVLTPSRPKIEEPLRRQRKFRLLTLREAKPEGCAFGSQKNRLSRQLSTYFESKRKAQRCLTDELLASKKSKIIS